MFGTSNFVRSLIMFLFTLFLIANILFAFNISAKIGGANVGPQTYGDLSGSYMGVSTFITNWEYIFGNSRPLNSLNDLLESVANALDVISLTHFIESSGSGGAVGNNILVILGTIVDTLFNLAYISLNLLYVLFTIIYVLVIVFTFLAFVTTFISGMFKTPLPDTQFPEIVPTMRFVLFYFSEII